MTPNGDQIAETVQNFREEASKTQSRFASERDAIRNDTSRSQEWKNEAISKAHLKQDEKLREIQEKETAYLTTNREKLETELFGVEAFGNDAKIVAYRDAVSRVEALSGRDEHKAQRMYDQAVRSNDNTLMQALFQRAIELDWNEVAERHVKRHPSKADAYKALRRAERIQRDGEPGMNFFAYVPLGNRHA